MKENNKILNNKTKTKTKTKDRDKNENENSFFIRIESGRYKGKKILLPSFETTRATKSIVKGSFFDSLQFEIIGKNFFEVFGGSGSMGLEALSRGAKKSYFIEKNKISFNILEKNCKNIAPDDCRIYLGDSFLIFENVVKEFNNLTIFYFDPPFDIRENMGDIYEKTIELISKIDKEIFFLCAVEHISSYEMPQTIGVYHKTKIKKFGNTSLSFYAKSLE